MSRGTTDGDLVIRRVRVSSGQQFDLVDLAVREAEIVSLAAHIDQRDAHEIDAAGAFAIPSLIEFVRDLEVAAVGAAAKQRSVALRRRGIGVVIDCGARIGRDDPDDALEQRAESLRGVCSQRVGFIVRLDPRTRQAIDLGRASAVEAAKLDGKNLTLSELDTLFTRAARKGTAVSARPFAATDLDDTSTSRCESRDWMLRTRTAVEVESVERLIDLARKRGTKLILSPISSAAAVDVVEDAIRSNLPIRAGTSVDHLLRDDDSPSSRRLPPKRGAIDRERLLGALLEGTLSFLAPREPRSCGGVREVPDCVDESADTVSDAEPLGNLLRIAHESGTSLAKLVALSTDGLLDAFQLPREPVLMVGAPADFFLFDPKSGRCVGEVHRGALRDP